MGARRPLEDVRPALVSAHGAACAERQVLHREARACGGRSEMLSALRQALVPGAAAHGQHQATGAPRALRALTRPASLAGRKRPRPEMASRTTPGASELLS